MARSRGGSTSEAKPASRSDVYTGLLLIALLAQIAGCVFFYLDWAQYPKTKVTLPPKQVTPSAGGAGGAGGQQAGGPGGNVQGGPPGGPAGAPGGPAGMPGGPAGMPGGPAGIPGGMKGNP